MRKNRRCCPAHSFETHAHAREAGTTYGNNQAAERAARRLRGASEIARNFAFSFATDRPARVKQVDAAVIRSAPPTPSMRSPTISAISCERWRCPRTIEPWSPTSLRRQADQDRRQSRQPWPLRTCLCVPVASPRFSKPRWQLVLLCQARSLPPEGRPYDRRASRYRSIRSKSSSGRAAARSGQVSPGKSSRAIKKSSSNSLAPSELAAGGTGAAF